MGRHGGKLYVEYVYAVDVESGAGRALTGTDGYDERMLPLLRWSPKGDKIAFMEEAHIRPMSVQGAGPVFVVDVKTGEETRLVDYAVWASASTPTPRLGWNLVKTVITGTGGVTTTVHVGGYYEWSAGSERKHYYLIPNPACRTMWNTRSTSCALASAYRSPPPCRSLGQPGPAAKRFLPNEPIPAPNAFCRTNQSQFRRRTGILAAARASSGTA